MSVTLQQLKKEVYEREKQRHPKDCYGMWTWVSGTLKVSCQGCGYRMRINPETKKLEHLPLREAVENCLEIKESYL